MLSKRIEITIMDYTATLSSKIQFYKNDEIDLIFNVREFGIVKNEGGWGKVKQLMPLTALSAKLLIETPAGLDSIETAEIHGNDIIFRLTSDQTKYTGTSKMQIVLYDEDGCKVTIPEFQFEVKASINEEWDGEDASYPDILLDDEGNVIVLEDIETALFK